MDKRNLHSYFSSNPSSSTLRNSESQPKRTRVEFTPDDIIADPACRKPVEDYPNEIRSELRRAYLLKGPTQLFGHIFPQKMMDCMRSFKESWFSQYDWLEYSESKDAAFCFYCFLFKSPAQPKYFGNDAFTKAGFVNWRKAKQKFNAHVGGPNSVHNFCRQACEDFNNQRLSVSRKLEVRSKADLVAYKIRLRASLDCARYLLMQGQAFRGHDESATSINKGNYKELVDWYKERNEEVKKAYDVAPRHCKMTSDRIQKDLAKACAQEVTDVIMDELGDRKFSVLIDESRDVSIKEQMAVIFSKGQLMERFIKLVHVKECTSVALKSALLGVLAKYDLSLSRVRGQGYDGASNMRGEFNGLQRHIRDENPYAFYVHCFAHQLQLAIVTVSSTIKAIGDFFNYVPLIVNTVSSSCKRMDALIEKHREVLLEKVENGLIHTGTGLHQESSLARPGDTRWGSHHKTLLRLYQMWEAIEEVLEIVSDDSRQSCNSGGAYGLIRKIESFEFVFILHLMMDLLGITNDLSREFQRKDLDIVRAMGLIMNVKENLQTMRDSGWESLLERVNDFCEENSINVPNMDEYTTMADRMACRGHKVTQDHFYRVDIFYAAIDATKSEISHRFNEVSTELLVCMSYLDPRNSFSKFDADKIMRLAEIYADDFTMAERTLLRTQLQNYIVNVRSSLEFRGCRDLARLAEKMVESGKDKTFPLVYRLIELTLILLVATASVERIFSAMKIIKTDLRNKISDGWLNNLMVCYTEKEIFKSIDDGKIMERFQKLTDRRMDLPVTPSQS